MPAREDPLQSAKSTAFQPEDVLRQAQIQDVALSPDGSTVVYSRRVIADNAYRTHLWIVPWSGGDARQLTHAAVNDTRPVFSPDGRSLAFISDRGGREQPWILPLDGGEPRLAADIAGRCQGRALVARWATVADHGAQRRRAAGRRRSEGPDRTRDRRLRLEARQDRIAKSVSERMGRSSRRR